MTHPCRQSAALPATQLMKSSCSSSPRAARADLEIKDTHAHARSQICGERRVIIVQRFPLRSSGGLWPITIVIRKSSPLQVRDIKGDNVSIIFEVPAVPLPPRVPAAAALMRASQDGSQRLLRTQNAITPNLPLLIGRQKPTGGLEVAPTPPSPAEVGGWAGLSTLLQHGTPPTEDKADLFSRSTCFVSPRRPPV